MSECEQSHEEKLTLKVNVLLPGHDERTETSLFSRSRKQLIDREKACFICGKSAEETGPLEAHHHPIERSFANMIDWVIFRNDCEAGLWGEHTQGFDWTNFDSNDPMKFVDDMTVNGMLVCKDHHTKPNEGIHTLPFPIWIAQKYGKEGYKFSEIEIIHHPSQVPK